MLTYVCLFHGKLMQLFFITVFTSALAMSFLAWFPKEMRFIWLQFVCLGVHAHVHPHACESFLHFFFFNFLANISQIWWGEGKPVSRIFFSENFLSFRQLGKNAREQETLEEVLWDTREKSCCKWPNLWKILNLSCHLL